MKKLFLLFFISLLLACGDTIVDKPFTQFSFEIDEIAAINHTTKPLLKDSIFQTILYNSRKESYQTKADFIETFVKNYENKTPSLNTILNTDNPIPFLKNIIRKSKEETAKVMRKRLIYKSISHRVYVEGNGQMIKVEVKNRNTKLINLLVGNANLTIQECLSRHEIINLLNQLNNESEDTIEYNVYRSPDTFRVGVTFNMQNYQGDLLNKKARLLKYNQTATHPLLLNENGLFSNANDQTVMPLFGIQPFCEDCIDGRHILNSEEDVDPLGQEILIVKLTEEGTQRFASLTERNLQRPLAILYKGKIILAPVVQGVITGGIVQLSGLEKEEIEQLNTILNTGMYATQVTLVGEDLVN